EGGNAHRGLRVAHAWSGRVRVGRRARSAALEVHPHVRRSQDIVSTVRKTPAGATRTCPHCRAVILQSTSVCPSCRKHLKVSGDIQVAPTMTPLRVDGSIRHPSGGEAWEYSAVVTITNDKGEEVG